MSRRGRGCNSGLIQAGLLLLCLACGCERQKQGDTGKTFSPDQQRSAGAGSKKAEGDGKPLGSPADTTNGKASRASDAGSSDATRGQVVAEPGAPVEHKPAPGGAEAPPSGGHR
jgi:hypothetical protein